MSDYALTPQAKADIFDEFTFVAEAPLRGHTRPDLTTRPLRFWTLARYPTYAVVYRPDTAPLQIVAVMHGKRDIRRILKQRQ
jgi:plasmid stabilization system protein ParE